MTRVGRPVNKAYSEFLQEGSKYAQSSVRWESLQDPNDKAIGIYGKKAVEQLKEFVIAKVVGYGS